MDIHFIQDSISKFLVTCRSQQESRKDQNLVGFLDFCYKVEIQIALVLKEKLGCFPYLFSHNLVKCSQILVEVLVLFLNSLCIFEILGYSGLGCWEGSGLKESGVGSQSHTYSMVVWFRGVEVGPSKCL